MKKPKKPPQKTSSPFFIILISLFLFMCLFCYGQLHADVWADFLGTNSTTGVDTGTKYNPTSTLQPPLTLLWSHTNWHGAGVTVIQESSPAVVNGIVYVGSEDGKLYAWNSSTGATQPGFPVIADPLYGISSSPAVVNGNVYVGCNNGKVYAWNAVSGAGISGFPVSTGGGILTPSPCVVNGYVYIGADDGNLYAWNAITGAGLSPFPVSTSSVGRFYNSPAVANGVVYGVPALDARLFAWNAMTGALMPGFPTTTCSM